jgi:hypothetical protein
MLLRGEGGHLLAGLYRLEARDGRGGGGGGGNGGLQRGLGVAAHVKIETEV